MVTRTRLEGAVTAIAFVASGLCGCFSSGGTAPSVVVPSDPTPLSKCQVSKSQASPLVTEWPASERAHLEGVLAERAVVVAYSGCEMRILDACRVPGSYRFQRTSLSRDTIEIRNADDLYAKIPLGAVGLEGELGRSGRLAVRTTVAGQLRLQGEASTVPSSDACRGATHVISALSVGAFELVSGGAIKAGGGVDVAVASAGARHESEETSLRASGDPKACSNTKTDTPNVDCASPIQVFLVPVAPTSEADGPSTHVAADSEPAPQGREPATKPAEPEPEPTRAPVPVPSEPEAPAPSLSTRRAGEAEPAADVSVVVDFAPPAPEERWSLLSSSGKLLCGLPCTRRVGRGSGYKLQLDADSQQDIVAVAVPDDLGYSPGRHVRATPVPARNSEVASTLFYLGATGVVVGLVVAAADKNGPDQKPCRQDEDGSLGGLCVGGIVTMAASGAVLLAGGVWWVAYSQAERLDVTLVDDSRAERETPVAGPRIGLGPGFLVGTF